MRALQQHDLSAGPQQEDADGSSQDGSVLAQPAVGATAPAAGSPHQPDARVPLAQLDLEDSDDDENSRVAQDPLRDHMLRSICELAGSDIGAASSIDMDELAALSTPRLATYMVQLQKAAEFSLSQTGSASLNSTARTPPRAPRTPQRSTAHTPTQRGAPGSTPIPVQVAALKQRLAAALKDNADLRKAAAAASTSQSASSVAARGAARDAASKAEQLHARLNQVVAQNEALDAQHQQLVVGLQSMRRALLDAIPADQRGSSSSLNISAISAASDASVPGSHKSETTLLHSVQSLLGKALAGYREHVAAARELAQARDAAAGAQANAARATQELSSAQETHARTVRELQAQLQAATRDAQAAREKAASDTQAALRARNAHVASAAAEAQRALADLRQELAGTTARADQAEAELSRAHVAARQARADAAAAQDAARTAQNQVLSLQERLALALKSRPAGSPRDAALLAGDTLFSLSSGSDDEGAGHIEGKQAGLGAVSVTSAGSHEPVQATESMLPRARAGSPTMQALHLQAAGQRRDATDLVLAKSQISRLQRQLHVAGVDTARAKELWRSAAETNFAAVTRVLKAADAVLSQLPAQEEGAITAADWLPKLSADVPEHLKAALRESALSPTGGSDQHVPAAVHIGLMGVAKRLGAQMAAAMKSAASSAAQLHEMRQVLDARDGSIAALGALAQDLQDQLDNARDEIQQLEHAQPSEAAAVRAARAEVATAWRAAEAAQREADVAKLALAKAETRASSIRAESARAAAEDELARARAAIGPVEVGPGAGASRGEESVQEISSSAGLHAALRAERDRLASTEQELTRATQALQMTQLQYAGRVELLRSQLSDAQAECAQLAQDLDIARTDAASRPSAAAWADAQAQVRALELELEAAEEAGLHRADLQARAHALRKERADAARLRRPGAGPPARQSASHSGARPSAVLQAACAELGLSDVTALPGAVRVLHKTVRAVQGLEVFVRACQEASVALQDAVHSSQQSLRQTAVRASQAAESMQLAQHSGPVSGGSGGPASSALWSSMSEMCAALATVSGHVPECLSPELQAPARSLPAPLQVILQVLATTISQLRTLPGLLVVLHRLAGQACGSG